MFTTYVIQQMLHHHALMIDRARAARLTGAPKLAAVWLNSAAQYRRRCADAKAGKVVV